MRRSAYVLVRFASLTVATFLLVAAPLLLMYVGGLLAGLPPRESGRFLGALVGAALLAACLSGLAALVSALTIRRGLAVAAVIVVLLVSYTVVVVAIQGISTKSGHGTVGGEVAGCSRRTPSSTACRWSSSTPRGDRGAARGRAAMGVLTSSRPCSPSAARSPGLMARYRRSRRDRDPASTTSRAGSATSWPSTTCR